MLSNGQMPGIPLVVAYVVLVEIHERFLLPERKPQRPTEHGDDAEQHESVE
jgi:hypothetical protein